MDSKMLKKVIFDSFLFTILPSVSILIGVVALSGKLGVPLPWIRLTVIGALHYEGAAVKAVIGDATSVATPEMFVTIAFVMTLGILTGPIYCLFGFKSYDKKILSKAKGDNEVVVKEENLVEENKKPKKNFGDVLFNAVFIAMICSFLAVDVAKVFDKEQGAIKNYVPIVVIITTFLSMFVLDMLQKKLKWKWLASFDLGLSMLIGMTVAVLVG
jgi:hypothetical protein